MAIKPFAPRPVISLEAFNGSLVAITPLKLTQEAIDGTSFEVLVADVAIVDGSQAGLFFHGARIFNPSIVDALNLEVGTGDTYVGRLVVKTSKAGNTYVSMTEPTPDDLEAASAHAAR